MAKVDWNHTGGSAAIHLLYRGVSPVFLPGTGRKKAHAISRRNAPVRACRGKTPFGFLKIKAAQLLNITTKYRVETEAEKPIQTRLLSRKSTAPFRKSAGNGFTCIWIALPKIRKEKQ